MTVPANEWKWFGKAGHLIVGEWCRFHMCTQVGPWLISTVGQYFPSQEVREIIAKQRGVTISGIGDAAERDYLIKIGFEEIGYDRTFETMVFRVAEKTCDGPICGCGIPNHNGSEMDSDGYNTAADATAGHLAMCEKWAARGADFQVEER